MRTKMPRLLRFELSVILLQLAALGWLLWGKTAPAVIAPAAPTVIALAVPPGPDRAPYMEYGGSPSTALDPSVLAVPGTKNARDLTAFVTAAWEHEWGYVWGTFGYELTEPVLSDKLAQYPDGVGRFQDFIRERWLGRRTADCIGLLKAYAWYDPAENTIEYGGPGMPDIDTEQLFEAASEKGDIASLPETPGLIVYCPGHVGVYVGDGYVIEAVGTETGVVKTKLAERPFTHWLECPYFDYES